MSINIGDNFSYLGKKFLDSRQSFPTLDAMNACTDVPVGFITFCEEDGERYEYRDGSWKILTITSNGSSDNTGGCDGSCCDNIVIPEGGTDAVIQEEEPEDTSVIWFDPEEEKPYQNDPYISELKEIIKFMNKQIQSLTSRIEYLENVVAGTIKPDVPIIPDDPIEDDYILLEDGTPLLLENGEEFLLEVQINNITTEDYILLEDDTPLLLENGEEFLLEKQTINTINQNELLLENDTPLLLENGESFLLER